MQALIEHKRRVGEPELFLHQRGGLARAQKRRGDNHIYLLALKLGRGVYNLLLPPLCQVVLGVAVWVQYIGGVSVGLAVAHYKIAVARAADHREHIEHRAGDLHLLRFSIAPHRQGCAPVAAARYGPVGRGLQAVGK
ncbi:MAG: hypothetical protein UY71_C0045G0009, partial [Parcubacteria group bacterium GW2011_GWB1_52_7]